MKLDFLFLIPTYDRYDSLVKIITVIEKQTKHLKCKIVVVNDNSNDKRYDNLTNSYDNIIYHKNPTNYGRDNFYMTVNELLTISRDNEAKHYVFLADDTLPSKNFINHIYSYINKGVKIVNTAINKEETYLNWGLKYWVDGCFVISHDVYHKINYNLIKSEIRKKFNNTTYGSGVYKAFSFRFKKYNVKVHYPKYSLVNHLGHTDSVMHTEKRKIEPIHSYSFIDNFEGCSIFRDEFLEFFNKKLQLKISDSVIFFKDKLMEKYNLTEYTSINGPTIFFGMYDDNDYKVFSEHVGEKVIIWTGSDALKLINKKSWHNKLQNSNNIAISSFINQTLNSINIKNVIKPITPTKNLINIKPKGEFIYWYYNSDDKKDFYGGKIVEQIEKLTKYKIIKTITNSFNHEQLKDIYEKCFLGFRFTEHDGLSNTVVELGLMGRYCIHNGDTPNSLKYDKNDINHIIKLIDYEYSKIDIINENLANETYTYLNAGSDLHNLFVSFDTTDSLNENNNNNNIGDIKKKSSEGTSSGKKVVKEEPKIQEQPTRPTQPIINTPIAIQKPNIQKPEPPKNMQTPKVMNKTHGDLFMGKSMKKNLRFGKR
jgi:hypothetical protein